MSSIAYLQKAYLAYFGRPVDATGIAAFGPTSTATDAQVNAAFFASPESQALYGTTFGVTQINAIYQMLFGRQAEPAGLAFWANEVARGALTPAAAAIGIMNGALNADAVAVTNKLAASAAYQAAIDTTPEILAYVGDAAAATARAFIATVTTTAPTAAAIDANILTLVANSGVGTGSTFTLTTGIDNVKGTSGNDTIIGDFAVASQVTASDQIDGGAGVDTLKLYGTYAAASLPAITNVEVLEIVAMGNASVTTAAIVGLTKLQIDQADAMTGQTATVGAGQSVQLATTVNAATAGANTVAYAAAATSADLILAGFETGIAAGARQNLTATGAAVTTFNVTANTAANTVAVLTAPATTTTLNINAATALAVNSVVAGAATKVNITGAGAVTIVASDFAATVAVDASGATGAVNYTAEAAGSTLTYTGSAGNDKVAFAATTLTTADKLTGGAGTDTIVINDVGAGTLAAVNASNTFEVLGLATTGLTLDVSLITNAAITAYRVETGNFTETFNNSLATTTYTIDNSAGNSGTVTIANKVGETVTGVTLDAGTATSAQTLANLTITGVTTTNLVSTGTGTGGANTLTTLVNPDNSVINITGAKDLVITNALAGTAVGSKVDATSFTGKLTVIGSGFADVIIGGTGNDTITGGNGNDTISGGAGNDRIIVTGANQADNITTGAGTDTVVFSAANIAGLTAVSAGTTAITSITDFTAGTDKIALVNTGGAQTSIVLSNSQTIATAASLTAVYAAIQAIAASVDQAATSAAVIVVSAGAAAGTYLYINDATAGVSNTADALINITGVSGTLAATDFVFA